MSIQVNGNYYHGYIYAENAKKEYRFKTHRFVHIDETLFLDLIRWEADESFLDQYCPNGLIEIGIGDGVFDDHSVQNCKNGEKNSAVMILAKMLKLEKSRKWKRAIRFAHLNDTRGRQNPRDIGVILKLLHYQRPDRQDENLEWALQGLWVKYYDKKKDGKYSGDYSIDRIKEAAHNIPGYQDAIDPEEWYQIGQNALEQDEVLFLNAIEELDEKIKTKEVIIHKFFNPQVHRKITIAAIESDNYKMSAAMRYKDGNLRSDVVIIRRSNGNIVISCNKYIRQSLRDAAVILRWKLQEKKVNSGVIKRIITYDWEDLRQFGEVDGAEEIHYDNKTEMIFNGSYTHPNVPEIPFTLNEIAHYVMISLNETVFKYTSCLKRCRGKECEWQPWGLLRCRKIRKEGGKRNNK